MSMKIIDMQVLLPRASEVSRVQQIHQQEHDQKQQEFIAQMAVQAEKAEAEVRRTPRNEESIIREKPEREKNSEKRQKKEGKQETEENTENKDQNALKKMADPRGAKVDIKV
ncbi:MAG: hypothetical protein ACM3UZ_07665 [Acidobacteriota bacterium]